MTFCMPCMRVSSPHLAPNGAVLVALAEGEYEIIKPCANDPQTWT